MSATNTNVSIEIHENESIELNVTEINPIIKTEDVTVNFETSETNIIERKGTFGFAVYTDTEHTINSPQEIPSNTPTLMLNNAGKVLNRLEDKYSNHSLWEDNGINSYSNGDSYDLRLSFSIECDVINTDLRIYIDIGGNVGEIQSYRTTLVNSVTNPTIETQEFMVYALDTFLVNGGKIYIEADSDVRIWNTSIFIRVEHN